MNFIDDAPYGVCFQSKTTTLIPGLCHSLCINREWIAIRCVISSSKAQPLVVQRTPESIGTKGFRRKRRFPQFRAN